MKVLGFCGTHKKNLESTSEFVLKAALSGAEAAGAETDMIKISDYNVIPCAGCGKCFKQNPCPLYNSPKDDLHKIIEKLTSADAIIFCSPVYAYGQPALMENFWQLYVVKPRAR
jgi:multimeric flavodoxin WrbA